VVSNVWFIVLWVRAEGPGGASGSSSALPDLLVTTPLWVLLGGGALQAIGLFAFAITLNDILDLHRDRAMKFDRPLATGSLSAEAAAALIAGTLIAAVMGSTVFGISGVLLTVALAGGALVYNAAARFVPAIGLPLIAGLYAGHLLVPSPQIAFLWPVWLVFTHVLVARLAAHALGRRMPRLSARGGVLLLIAWLGGSAALAALSVARNGGTPEGVWPGSLSPSAAIAPAVLLLPFGLAVWRVAVKRGTARCATARSGCPSTTRRGCSARATNARGWSCSGSRPRALSRSGSCASSTGWSSTRWAIGSDHAPQTGQADSRLRARWRDQFRSSAKKMTVKVKSATMIATTH
jgi:hypothetical protein